MLLSDGILIKIRPVEMFIDSITRTPIITRDAPTPFKYKCVGAPPRDREIEWSESMMRLHFSGRVEEA